MSTNMPLAKATRLVRLSVNNSGKFTLLALVGALYHQMQMSWVYISITEKEWKIGGKWSNLALKEMELKCSKFQNYQGNIKVNILN